MHERRGRRHTRRLGPVCALPTIALPLVALALGCRDTDSPTAPEAVPRMSVPAAPTAAFRWVSSTPESQGMCGNTRQLGCTRSLLEIWNDISNAKHNTKRFIVIRNYRVLYDMGAPAPTTRTPRPRVSGERPRWCTR